MKLQGILASVATPFDHTGAIYRAKVQHNFDKWRRTSVAGFVIGGHAGEGPLLDAEEKLEILRLAVPPGEQAAAGANSDSGRFLGRRPSARLNWRARAAEAGANAVVSLVPHQYRNLMYGPEAQMLFFRALADQSPVPVLIHNAPQVTGVDLLPEIVGKLAAHPNIAGVIESGTPAGRIAEIRENVPKEFSVLAGTESQLLGFPEGGR